MKILFLPKYSIKGASSRYRTYQYLDLLKEHEHKVKPLFDESYVPAAHIYGHQSKFYVIKRYFLRLVILMGFKKHDFIFLEKEFFPYTPFLGLVFKIFKIKYIVDYDDAIFHRYDQNKSKWIQRLFKNKISKVIKNASLVITGSPYLTGYALKFNKNVIEIPTSIDFRKYEKVELPKEKNEKLIIGWIGSKTTSINVLNLLPAFKSLKDMNLDFEIRLIGFDIDLRDHFVHLPVKFIEWSSESEVEEISKFSLGVMPLEDNLFNRGKCAFKLIQYMACGIPTISSSFEANIKVDRGNGNLFADNNEQWIKSFINVSENPEKYKDIGEKNIKTVKEYYSIQSNITELREIFKKMNH